MSLHTQGNGHCFLSNPYRTYRKVYDGYFRKMVCSKSLHVSLTSICYVVLLSNQLMKTAGPEDAGFRLKEVLVPLIAEITTSL